jgi:murein DD-endopeptidase MepM/ murein hydrolase activator NlpD
MNGHKRSVHGGIDFRGAEGTPVRSINSGTVVIADNEFFGGNTVVIDHGEGIFSVYMHLKEIFVKEGQFVNKSYIIGHVGSTGRATGPHLHISVKYGGMTVNPLSLFRSPLE